ncbi:hypothetical protein LTS18_001873, partial [Coniosporium uncinatum]
HLFAHPDRPIPLPTGPVAKTLAPPPDIVANVQGSSAGAGSGEFHVYKASRRREYERLRLMDEEVRKEEADQAFEREREEKRRADEDKTERNRMKREKARMRKKGKRKGGKEEEGVGDAARVEKNGKLAPRGLSKREEREGTEDEGEAVDGGEVRSEEIGIVIHDED